MSTFDSSSTIDSGIEELLCDLSRDHVLINPRVLACGQSVCFSCIKTKFKYDEFKKILLCNCCGKEHHQVMKLDDLPKNFKIEKLLKKQIVEVTNDSLKRTNYILYKTKDLYTNRVQLIEEYTRSIRKSVEARIRSIRVQLDELSAQLNGTIDELQRDFIQKSDRLNMDLQLQSKNYQKFHESMLRKLKDTENFDSIIDDLHESRVYLTEFEGFNEKLQSILQQYTFNPNNWQPNMHLIGYIQNRKIDFKSIEVNDIEVYNGIKAITMCVLDNEIYLMENRHSRKVLVFNTRFECLRESKLFDDSVHRLKQSLTLMTDTNELIYLCDSADSRIYVTDRKMSQIHRIIGTYGKRQGQLNNPTHSCYFSDMIFVLDSGNCRVQVFHVNGTFGREFYLFNESNSSSGDRCKLIAVCEDTIAILNEEFGVFIYDFDGRLKATIVQTNVKSLCLKDGYLFMHVKHGGFLLCYKIHKAKHQKYQCELIFSRTNEKLENESRFMIFIDQKLYISFPHQKIFAIIGT